MTSAADILRAGLEAAVATSLALLIVMLLRRPLRHVFGARIALGAWALVPAVLLAVLLPAAADAPASMAVLALVGGAAPTMFERPAVASPDWASAWLALWVSGMLTMATVFFRRQRAFHRQLGRLKPRADGSHQAQSNRGLPAAVGLWRPRIIVPADFDARYDEEERALLRLHERQHIVHGDLQLNAFAALLRCLFWFNPLVHYAARGFRQDQELACDQRVIGLMSGRAGAEGRVLKASVAAGSRPHRPIPHIRRKYGEAMLKTQLAAQAMPLACHWGLGHPLKERITMLKMPVPSAGRWLAGSACVLVLALAGGYAAWAAQPGATATSVPAGRILVSASLRVDDGAPQALSAVVKPGEPFMLQTTVNGHEWSVSATVQPDTQDLLMFAADITRDGKSLGAPKIAMKRGVPGTIRIGDDTTAIGGGFRGVELEVALTDNAAKAAGPTRLAAPGIALEAGDPNSVERLTPPHYPAQAVANKQSGTVVLNIDMDETGRVTAVEVEKAEPAGVFDAAAVEAAWKWHFDPPVKNGKRVPGRVQVPVQFELDAPQGVGAKPQA